MNEISSNAAPVRRKPPNRGKQGGRAATVTVRLSEEERSIAEQKAAEAQLKIGPFFRRAALGHAGARAQRRVSVDVSALSKLQAQIGHLSGNVNQIAKALNLIAKGGWRAGDHIDDRAIVVTLEKLGLLADNISLILRPRVDP